MIDSIQKIVTNLLELMGFDIKSIDVTYENEIYRVNITSNDGSLIIGRHGDNLSSLQLLVTTIINSNNQTSSYIIIDVENYKKKQEDNVIELAKRKAERVINTGESELMPPMNAYYRKIIHMHFVDNNGYPGIKTISVGEGIGRQVKLFKDEELTSVDLI